MDNPTPSHTHIGCAGWSIPKEFADRFPVAGSHLERYAERFPAVEINTSFYRPHRPATYARWAQSVPDGFRFAVKMPQEVTHERRLVDMGDVLDRFISEATQLGSKLGPILVQLPPSLPFSAKVAETFLTALRDRFAGEVALEPRHTSWFTAIPERLMTEFRVARVAADPAVTPPAAEPGGWDKLVYYRLHGSPRTYYSTYSHKCLEALSLKLLKRAPRAVVWCIFDNTAEGAATLNGLDLLDLG